jgi:hypothetical protein
MPLEYLKNLSKNKHTSNPKNLKVHSFISYREVFVIVIQKNFCFSCVRVCLLGKVISWLSARMIYSFPLRNFFCKRHAIRRSHD